jgi:thiamine-monophosphate kinase
MVIADAAELLAAHLDPVPRLAAGTFLATRGRATACMDLSDGLSLDLHRLCEASRSGALVTREAIPISQATRSWAKREGWDPEELALNGGEDYELVFTAPRKALQALSRWPLHDGTGPLDIGIIVSRRDGFHLVDAASRLEPLRPLGYDAFRKRRLPPERHRGS